MTPGCITISEDATVAEAAEAMAAHRVHAVLVLGAENGTPLGWVTARGLLGWLGRDRSLASARDAITEQVTAIAPARMRARRALRALDGRHHAAAGPRNGRISCPRACSPTSTSPWRRGADPGTEEGRMYRKIIVGYDGRPASEDALAFAKLIADATGAQLIVAGVFQFDPLWGGRDPAFHEAEREYARAVERRPSRSAAQAEAIPSSSPARGLHELAEESGADLVVVGSSSDGKLGQVLAGNVALTLLHGSPCSVAVAPRGYAESAPGASSEITVGFDGTPESFAALHDTVDLARASGAAAQGGDRGRATADRLRQGRRTEPGLARAQGRDREA